MRLGVLTLAFAYIWGTPFVRQVMKVHQPYARMWVMFGGYARDTCLVELETEVDGQRTPLDRFELLSIPDPSKAPHSLRFAERQNAGEPMIRSVCRRLPDGAPLYAEVRCLAGDEGWKVMRRADEDACAAVGLKR